MPTNYSRVLKALVTPGSPLNPIPDRMPRVTVRDLVWVYGPAIVRAALPEARHHEIPQEVRGMFLEERRRILSDVVRAVFPARKPAKTLPFAVRSYSDDPGRPSGDSQACAVAALASSTGWRYADAHAVAELLAKRKVGKGTYIYRMLSYGSTEIMGRWFHRVPTPAEGVRLATFLKFAKPGERYFVVKRDHAFAIVDGVVVDNGSMNRRGLTHVKVEGAWLVNDVPPAEGARVRRSGL